MTFRAMTTHAPRTALALLVASLALAGCGEDEKKGGAGGAGGTGGSAGSGGGAGMAGSAGMGGSALPPLVDDPRVPVTETVPVDELEHPVDVVRDRHGHVHIFARTVEDALFVQGWMMMNDRAGSVELARRLAIGRLAELYGALDGTLVDDDITMKTIGLHRVAKRIYDALPADGEVKRALDAFARGISAYNERIRDGRIALNKEFLGMKPEQFEPWEGWHSIAMARVQSWNLSYDADSEISFSSRWKDALATFHAGASDPLVAVRAGYAREVIRMAPIVPAVPLTGYPDEASAAKILPQQAPAKLAKGGKMAMARNVVGLPHVNRSTLQAAQPFARSVEKLKRVFGYDEHAGSNNWAVAGSHTQSGHAMVASDPHLGFTAPMIFWPAHVVVSNPTDPAEDFDLTGLAFVGIPGVILGTNGDVAWGATTTGYDVTDVWSETVTSDGSGVVFQGNPVPFERIAESVGDGRGNTYSWDVLVVPHHGPIVPAINASHEVDPPTAATGALSVRWTGHEPSSEFEAIWGMLRSKTVSEAREQMKIFGVGNQNWMLADTAGDIAWTAPAIVPFRDERALSFDPTDYSGVHPGLVLDGASGQHEWTGEFLDERYFPKMKDPASGWIATANTDNVGTTLDNDPTNDRLPDGRLFYIGFDFVQGFRLGRIQERLDAATTGGNQMTAEEMASIQGDVKSGFGARLADDLVALLERAEAERTTPGTHPDLASVVADSRYAAADVADAIDSLKKWQTEAQFEAASGIDPDDNSRVSDAVEANASKATFIFNAWLVRAMALTLEDEAGRIGRQNAGSNYTERAFVRLMEEVPSSLPTFDPATGESALWDDIDTAPIEKKDTILGRAFLAAIDEGNRIFGTDRAAWRWGSVHTVRFDALNPLWPFTVPPTDDPVFAAGWPRHGDQHAVDACNFGTMRGRTADMTFDYGGGPVQRFVAEMDPAGVIVRNALPGGAVADTKSRHFSNQAELWRRNENHVVPRALEDVIAAYETGDEHLRFTP